MSQPEDKRNIDSLLHRFATESQYPVRDDRFNLREHMLLNVAFIEPLHEFRFSGEKSWSANPTDLLYMRMACFVDQLFTLQMWCPNGLTLVYADLSFFDHDNDVRDIALEWMIGHRLGRKLDWDELLARYRQHVEDKGTSVRRRDYLLGEVPNVFLEELMLDFSPSESHFLLEPSRHTIGAAEPKPSGQHSSYLQNVIFRDFRNGMIKQKCALLHFQSGIEDRPVSSKREACSGHLYLTFLTSGSLEAESLNEVKKVLDSNPAFAERRREIQDELLRLSGLFLIEKSKRLRAKLEVSRQDEQEKNARLTRQVTTLLQQLSVVDTTARELRQALVAPLERYRSWVQELLPKLFEPTTGSLRKLRPEFEDVGTEHNQGLWTQSHIIAALWLLCEPPIMQWLKDAAREGVPSSEGWRFLIREAARRDSGDPWYFCAGTYAVVPNGTYPRLAGMMKEIQKVANTHENMLRLDGLVLQFLVGERIDESSEDVRIPDRKEGTVSLMIPDVWQEPVFVGVPRLAWTVKDQGAKCVRVNIVVSGPAEPVEPNSYFTIAWTAVGASPASLVASVLARVSGLIEDATVHENNTGAPPFTSALLGKYSGRNDKSNVIARVLLPESGLVNLKVERNTDEKIIIKNARTEDPVPLSIFEICHDDCETGSDVCFRLLVRPLSLPSS